ncbi:MAG: EamA family transporter [Thermoplasmata archaeon]
MSILITVILSVVVIGEKIDKLKIIGAGLAVVSFFFLYPIDSDILCFSLGNLYLIGLVLSLGLSTVFLRLGIMKKGVNHTRFFRSLVQTILIFSAVFMISVFTGTQISLNSYIVYPALNGIIGAFAFILFCKGLTTVGASAAKPMMVLATITTVSLGIILLNESIFLSKAVGIVMAVLAVIFLSYDQSHTFEGHSF